MSRKGSKLILLYSCMLLYITTSKVKQQIKK